MLFRSVGKVVRDEASLIEARTGVPVTDAWIARFRARRNEALERDLVAVRNVHAAVQALHARHQGRIACASGADRVKVELQLRKVALWPYFEGRVFSGIEQPRSKPAPDVYLAAAGALSVDPSRCAVVEDTVTGATAGVAAGATVFGYSPPEAGHDSAEALRRAGVVHVFTDMARLPEVLDAWRG